MKKHRIENFKRGWIIGDFEPALKRSKDFEVAMKQYFQGDKEAPHVHRVATEYTLIGAGRFRMNGENLEPGDIVEIQPNQVADFECLESGVTFVVKTPSAPDDKEVIKL